MTSGAYSTTSRGKWRGRTLIAPALVAMTVIVYSLPLLRCGDFDNDECLYVLAAGQSQQAGLWLRPVLEGSDFIDKPPLQFWLLAVAHRLWGDDQVSLRLPALIWTVLSYLLLFHIGRRHWHIAIGAGACFLLLTLKRFHIRHGVLMAVMEPALIAGWLLAFAGAFSALSPSHDTAGGQASRKSWLCAGLGVAIGFLSKSAAGLAPLGVFITAAVVAPRGRRLSVAQFTLWSAGFATLLTAPWIVAQTLAGPSNYWPVFWEMSLGKRAFGYFDTGHVKSAGFYLATIYDQLPHLLPLAAIGAAISLLTARQSAPWPPRLLLLWTTVPVAMFSAMTSKLAHYIYPVYPAIALLAAIGLYSAAGWAAAVIRRATAVRPTAWKGFAVIFGAVAAFFLLQASWSAVGGIVRRPLDDPIAADRIARQTLAGICCALLSAVAVRRKLNQHYVFAAALLLIAAPRLWDNHAAAARQPAPLSALREILRLRADTSPLQVINLAGGWEDIGWCRLYYLSEFPHHLDPGAEAIEKILSSQYDPLFILNERDAPAFEERMIRHGRHPCSVILGESSALRLALVSSGTPCQALEEFASRIRQR